MKTFSAKDEDVFQKGQVKFPQDTEQAQEQTKWLPTPLNKPHRRIRKDPPPNNGNVKVKALSPS